MTCAPPGSCERHGRSQAPSLALGPSGSVYAVWEEWVWSGGVAFARSTDDGATFSPPKLLLPNYDYYSYAQQQVAAVGAGSADVVATATA